MTGDARSRTGTVGGIAVFEDLKLRFTWPLPRGCALRGSAVLFYGLLAVGLHAGQHPEIAVKLSGLTLSSGDGRFQAYGARIRPEDKAKLVPGVAYGIKSIKASDTYRWAVAPDLKPIAFEPPGTSDLESKISRLQAAVAELKTLVDQQAKELRELRESVEELRKAARGTDE